MTINPNPVQDKLVIALELAQQQELVTLVIHNALGQRVCWQAFSQVQQGNININLGDDLKGI